MKEFYKGKIKNIRQGKIIVPVNPYLFYDIKTIDYIQNCPETLGYKHYVKVEELNNYINRNNLKDGFYRWENVLKDYLQGLFEYLDYDDDDQRLHESIVEYTDKYFKYMPFLRKDININVPYFSISYCCSGCDGNYKDFIRNFIRNTLESPITDDLRHLYNIKIVNLPNYLS